MGDFIHVDVGRLESGMRRHRELMEGDERWQDEERYQLEEAQRVKERREIELRNQRSPTEPGGE